MLGNSTAKCDGSSRWSTTRYNTFAFVYTVLLSSKIIFFNKATVNFEWHACTNNSFTAISTIILLLSRLRDLKQHERTKSFSLLCTSYVIFVHMRNTDVLLDVTTSSQRNYCLNSLSNMYILLMLFASDYYSDMIQTILCEDSRYHSSLIETIMLLHIIDFQMKTNESSSRSLILIIYFSWNGSCGYQLCTFTSSSIRFWDELMLRDSHLWRYSSSFNYMYIFTSKWTHWQDGLMLVINGLQYHCPCFHNRHTASKTCTHFLNAMIPMRFIHFVEQTSMSMHATSIDSALLFTVGYISRSSSFSIWSSMMFRVPHIHTGTNLFF